MPLRVGMRQLTSQRAEVKRQTDPQTEISPHLPPSYASMGLWSW